MCVQQSKPGIPVTSLQTKAITASIHLDFTRN